MVRKFDMVLNFMSQFHKSGLTNHIFMKDCFLLDENTTKLVFDVHHSILMEEEIENVKQRFLVKSITGIELYLQRTVNDEWLFSSVDVSPISMVSIPFKTYLDERYPDVNKKLNLKSNEALCGSSDFHEKLQASDEWLVLMDVIYNLKFTLDLNGQSTLIKVVCDLMNDLEKFDLNVNVYSYETEVVPVCEKLLHISDLLPLYLKESFEQYLANELSVIRGYFVNNVMNGKDVMTEDEAKNLGLYRNQSVNGHGSDVVDWHATDILRLKVLSNALLEFKGKVVD